MTFIFHLFYRNIVEGVSFTPIYISPKEEVFQLMCVFYIYMLYFKATYRNEENSKAIHPKKAKL